MSQTYISLETERLLLTPSSLDDAAFMLTLLNTPKYIQFIADRNVRTLDDAAAYVRNRMLPQLEKLGFSNFTVSLKEDGTKIGSCGLYEREGLEIRDIGFAFLPEYEGKGYAYEAANAVKKAAFETFHQRAICAITTRENKSSQKLIERLGLTFQKIVRIPNDPEDLLYYEFTAADYR
ncbi:Protein N-acetyltransferase, RimJ/RimL family [Pustulibacterium marinum]|uniref:Protein N-acetyltransferase, RimJ/RimL family n=1 Tax=Pustulibacterium marinum TaxID=1224947 RepID=A0A1I7IDT0_9FLAO|nr:GNAT family N-acetyltransferase [Pustulibacterium marinum]SFU71123.1 Protein N-acetyltransferase, RimJ/RimL family [Pustulibacterium marinum]